MSFVTDRQHGCESNPFRKQIKNFWPNVRLWHLHKWNSGINRDCLLTLKLNEVLPQFFSIAIDMKGKSLQNTKPYYIRWKHERVVLRKGSMNSSYEFKSISHRFITANALKWSVRECWVCFWLNTTTPFTSNLTWKRNGWKLFIAFYNIMYILYSMQLPHVRLLD